MTGTATLSLDRARLRAIRSQVFRERVTTMRDAALPLSLADLGESLLAMRREIRALLTTLPDDAFAARPANGSAGELVWTAGQTIFHLLDAQVNTFGRAARLAAGMPPGIEAGHEDDPARVPALARGEALVALDRADRDLDELLTGCHGASLERTVADPIFGACGVQDMLLFLAIHDDDHLGQLQGMAS